MKGQTPRGRQDAPDGRMGGDSAPVQGCVLQPLVWLWGPWHPGSPGAEAEQLCPRVWTPPSQGAEQVDQAAHRPQPPGTVRKSGVDREGRRKEGLSMAVRGSGAVRAGAVQGPTCSFGPTNIHSSSEAPSAPSGQAHPVHLLLGFLGLRLGAGRIFWTIARLAPAPPEGSFSSAAPHPTRGPQTHQGQKGPHLGTQRGCRAPPGWPLLGRTCPQGWGRARNGCASLGPLQGRGSSGSRRTGNPRVSSPTPLQGKGQDTARGPAGRGGSGDLGEVREAMGATEGLMRMSAASAPRGPPPSAPISLSEQSLPLNLVHWGPTSVCGPGWHLDMFTTHPHIFSQIKTSRAF